jgi:hypothetical protein
MGTAGSHREHRQKSRTTSNAESILSQVPSPLTESLDPAPLPSPARPGPAGRFDPFVDTPARICKGLELFSRRVGPPTLVVFQVTRTRRRPDRPVICLKLERKGGSCLEKKRRGGESLQGEGDRPKWGPLGGVKIDHSVGLGRESRELGNDTIDKNANKVRRSAVLEPGPFAVRFAVGHKSPRRCT